MNLLEPTTALEFPGTSVEPFSSMLARHNLCLTRKEISTLQVNVGLICNQICRHCHLEAGPSRREIMHKETVREVVGLAEKHHFACIDITGGAPEMNPDLPDMLARLAPLTEKLMLRSNLTAIAEEQRRHVIDACLRHRVTVIASFPAVNEAQADAQRGQGVFGKSLAALKLLNALGYGQPDSGLELNLVSNPTGAFLPPPQHEVEKRFRDILQKKWGLSFNRLFTFANVPLGRFSKWLSRSGNFENYMQKLAAKFNPCSIEGLMCRTLLSVSWDGFLYDCDFNQAMGLFAGKRKTHISEIRELPAPGSTIRIADHCYTCTAGAGFT